MSLYKHLCVLSLYGLRINFWIWNCRVKHIHPYVKLCSKSLQVGGCPTCLEGSVVWFCGVTSSCSGDPFRICSMYFFIQLFHCIFYNIPYVRLVIGGQRKLNNEICHWPSAVLARKAGLLDTEARVLSALSGPPPGLLVQDSGPGIWHIEYKIAQWGDRGQYKQVKNSECLLCDPILATLLAGMEPGDKMYQTRSSKKVRLRFGQADMAGKLKTLLRVSIRPIQKE